MGIKWLRETLVIWLKGEESRLWSLSKRRWKRQSQLEIMASWVQGFWNSAKLWCEYQLRLMKRWQWPGKTELAKIVCKKFRIFQRGILAVGLILLSERCIGNEGHRKGALVRQRSTLIMERVGGMKMVVINLIIQLNSLMWVWMGGSTCT